MKAHELRLGNLLKPLFNNEVEFCKVVGIDEEYVYSNCISFYYTEIGEFEPIPLTEEWLLKFGFEKDKEYDNTFNRYIDVLNGFTTITIDVRAEVLLLDNMEIKIKYVHQLQSLYFALTNRELTIKNEYP